MFIKRSLTFLLVLTIVISGLYQPRFAPKAHAFWGFGDINFEIGSHVRSIVNGIAMVLAQQMVDHMVQSTVKWAQSGFEGNPAYVTDPQQYFRDITDGAIGEFIKGGDLGFLCSPFQANIKLSLVQEYSTPKQYQCTLTNIVDNIDDFYNDFSKGGWDAWFSMTQNDSNNPYGAYLQAKIDLDSRIASKLGIEQQKLNWSQGFLSWSDCLIEDGETGKCDTRGPTKTPGSVIKSQLDQVLPSGLNKLISAQSMDQLVSSFASGLLTRYVFGPRGLFASGSNPGGSGGTSIGGSRAGMVDLDGDGIPDGQDSDYDGLLTASTDTCFHGGSAPNCIKSSTVSSSPYFTPVCEAVDQAVAVLGEYGKFLDSHANQMEGGSNLQGAIIGGILRGPVGVVFGVFGLGGGSGVDNFKVKADADIWANRTSEADSAVDQVLSNIRNRHSSYFDEMEIATNRFSNYLGKVLESLIKDKDLDLARRGNGGGGLENLMKQTGYNLRYLQEVKVKIGKCEKPDISGAAGIPLPPEVEEGQSGGQCLATGNVYAGALSSAMGAVISSNPDVANLPNTETASGQKPNGKTFLALVATELQSMGYNATADVLNGNNNPNTGDAIAIWKSGDDSMERYDALSGDTSKKISEVTMTDFTGFIPLNCTTTGGGNECGCQSDSGGSTSEPTTTEPSPTQNPTPGTLYVSSVSPSAVNPGGTITVSGDALTSTVQFFDGNGARYTVTGSLNAARTQVTVTVPVELPIGNATVKVYKDASTVSNGKLIQIISGSGATVSAVNATGGWGGNLAFNPSKNNWLIVSGGVNGMIMGNNQVPLTSEFKIQTTSDSVQVMSPKVAYAPNIDKYLVVWIGFPDASGGTIYGRFINADGSFSGNPFIIFKDPAGGTSFFYPNSALQYDSTNKKFALVWDYRHPTADAYLVTIDQFGTPSTPVKVGDDANGDSWLPSIAINTANNEYCIAYDKRNKGNTVAATRRYNPTTGILGTETVINNAGMYTSIVYNSVGNKYLIGWNNGTAKTSQARILNSCNIADGGSIFTSNSYGQTQALAYNSFSNTYASIVQNQMDSGNSYNIFNSTGMKITSGTAFAQGFGNFAPAIAANIKDGTFAATSAYEYSITRFVSELNR